MSERGRSLLLDLAVWLDNGRWLTQPSSLAEEPIQSFVGPRLKKRHKKLVKQGAGLAKLAPGPRHHIRIKAKELRYMAEFFVDVPGIAQDRKRLKKLINCCEKLQTALGAIRDAEAMAEFMERDNWEDAETARDATKTAILASGHPLRAENGTEKELKKAVRAYLQLAGYRGVLRLTPNEACLPVTPSATISETWTQSEHGRVTIMCALLTARYELAMSKAMLHCAII